MYVCVWCVCGVSGLSWQSTHLDIGCHDRQYGNLIILPRRREGLILEVGLVLRDIRIFLLESDADLVELPIELIELQNKHPHTHTHTEGGREGMRERRKDGGGGTGEGGQERGARMRSSVAFGTCLGAVEENIRVRLPRPIHGPDPIVSLQPRDPDVRGQRRLDAGEIRCLGPKDGLKACLDRLVIAGQRPIATVIAELGDITEPRGVAVPEDAVTISRPPLGRVAQRMFLRVPVRKFLQ